MMWAFAAVAITLGAAGVFMSRRQPKRAAPAQHKSALDAGDTIRQETLSLITRTLGHDFGNMIAATGMSLSLAKLKLERNPAAARQALEDAEAACERATKLAMQLVALSRGESQARHVTQLHDLLQLTAQVCERESNAPIELNLQPNLHHIECDESQLALVFYALIMTAVADNSDGRRVPVTADNWKDPRNGEDYCRIRVAHGTSGRRAGGPALSLSHVDPLIRAHKGKLLRESDAQGGKLTLLLPSVADIR